MVEPIRTLVEPMRIASSKSPDIPANDIEVRTANDTAEVRTANTKGASTIGFDLQNEAYQQTVTGL
jgi:hypothetical protein